MNDNIGEELKETLGKIKEELKEERDELNLKMHLAKAEVKEEWHELEKKWQHFLSRAHLLEGAAKESTHEIGAAAVLLGEELKSSFKRVRKLL